MKSKTIYHLKQLIKQQGSLFALAFFLLGLLACASNHRLQEPVKFKSIVYTPKNFLKQAGKADLVVITDDYESDYIKVMPIHLKIQGRDAANIIATIRNFKADRDDMHVIDSVFKKMIFYKGTNQLATAGMVGRYFKCEDGQFIDRSGVIEGVSKIYSQFEAAREREWQAKVIQPEVFKLLQQKHGSTNF